MVCLCVSVHVCVIACMCILCVCVCVYCKLVCVCVCVCVSLCVTVYILGCVYVCVSSSAFLCKWSDYANIMGSNSCTQVVFMNIISHSMNLLSFLQVGKGTCAQKMWTNASQITARMEPHASTCLDTLSVPVSMATQVTCVKLTLTSVKWYLARMEESAHKALGLLLVTVLGQVCVVQL